GGRTVTVGYLYYSLHFICFAWNKLEEAADALSQMLLIGHDWQQVDLLNLGKLFQVLHSLVVGDLNTAQETIQQMERLVEQEGFANHASWLLDARLQWWLAQGNLEEASNWAAQAELHPDSFNPFRKWE